MTHKEFLQINKQTNRNPFACGKRYFETTFSEQRFKRLLLLFKLVYDDDIFNQYL